MAQSNREARVAGYSGYGSDDDLDTIVGGFDDLELSFHAGIGVETPERPETTETGGPDGVAELTNSAAGSASEAHVTCDACDTYDVRDGSESESAGDMTCAICLHSIDLPDMAMVKGCDHLYCACCILQWTLHKSEASCVCPTCKRAFSYLLTYRALDGTLNDFPMEESVVLLRRSQWFEEWVRESENASCQSLLEEAKLADDTAWQEDYDEDEYWEEEEKMEAFYFSSAAGKARIVLGNRRFGSGGYISGGRRLARPIQNNGASGSGTGTAAAAAAGSASGAATGTPSSKAAKHGKNSKKQKNKGHVKASHKEIRPETSKAIHIATPNSQVVGKEYSSNLHSRSFASDGYGSSPASGSHGMGGILGCSPSAAPGFGRRASRKARIAAEKSHVEPSETNGVVSATTGSPDAE